MSTDETPPEGGRGAPSPWADRWNAFKAKIPPQLKSPLVAVGAAALVLGFGGGFAVGKVADLGWFGGKSAATAEAPKGQAWSLFGKPRSANAPRRGIPKPEGFAVWQSRIDSSGAEPMACVRMSKPL